MPDSQPDANAAATEPSGNEPAAPPSRPEPPPYEPDRDLIGYVERGQKPEVKKRERERHSDSAPS